MASAWNTLDRRLNEREMLSQSLPQIKTTFPRLSNVQSCAMIGCGYGFLDLEFACGCLPNITELTAVEPDADQMAELKTRVAQLLPTVTANFYQEKAESWKGADKLFDVVLLFHCLYFVPLLERPTLLKKLFDNVVASGGLVFILISPCNLQNRCSITRLIGRLSQSNSWIEDTDIDGIQIYDMMTSVGFRDCYQLPIQCEMNVKELDDDFMDLFVFWRRGRLSREQVRDAAKEVFADEKTVPHEMWLGVFRKP